MLALDLVAPSSGGSEADAAVAAAPPAPAASAPTAPHADGPGTKGEKKASGATSPKTAVPPALAVGFTLTKDQVGEKTVNQLKSNITDAFRSYGPVDECRLLNNKDDTKTVTLFFTGRLFEKGQGLQAKLTKKEEVTVNIWDHEIRVSLSNEKKGSGGGRTSGTSGKKSNKPPADGGRGRGRGRGKDGDEKKKRQGW